MEVREHISLVALLEVSMVEVRFGPGGVGGGLGWVASPIRSCHRSISPMRVRDVVLPIAAEG